MKKFIGIFDKRPLIWFHYVLLVFVLFGGYFGAAWLGFISPAPSLPFTSWLILFFWYYVVVSIGDQIIHAILRVD